MKVVSSMIMLCLCIGSAQAVGLRAKKRVEIRTLPDYNTDRPVPVHPKDFERRFPAQSAQKDVLAPIPDKQFPHAALPGPNEAHTVGGLQEGKQKAAGPTQHAKMRPTICSHPSCLSQDAKPPGHVMDSGGIMLETGVGQPSAADMAKFDAEGPQQMAAAKAAGNCKMLANPMNIFRCQEELANEAHDVIGKALAANKCGSLSKVEDITACLKLLKAKVAGSAALAKSATALVEQPSAADMAKFDAEGPPQMAAAKAAVNCKILANPMNALRCQEELAKAANNCADLSKAEDITACLKLLKAKSAIALVEQPSAADMAKFDAEGPQQMAAAKAAGNCKILANPMNVFRCQEELTNEAHDVIGKAMAANKCGSLSKVEDITACLKLLKASAGSAALAKHA